MLSDSQYADAIILKKIRPSVQRIAIYKYIYEHKNHPTVDTIYTALNPSYPTLSRTTVYNTLHLFAENNLVQAIKIEDDELRYDANMAPHLHFKCLKCGKIYDIFDSRNLPQFNMKCIELMPKGFSVEHIQTCIWGLCSECSEE